ncbi:carbonic anhydrase 4a [Chiloscyllium plagiosum]|uniref:carbonic anhydrase 4a n=1 Tax=Chiloscyllium plagiosum TaxID=36176 RepID=UPI001CB7D286|nr:carbonic anhydrase 4a [Chiloscyllium plagiosum]
MYSLVLLVLSFCLPFLRLGAGQWCYDIQNVSCGPATWKNDYATCGLKSQSPINIVTKKAKFNENLTPFIFHGYDHVDTKVNWPITNNGHTVTVTLNKDITIKGGNLPYTYKAAQFHYHWGTETDPGSEHTIDGEQYPMEMHIVHYNEKYGNLENALKHSDGVAVLGFLFEESNENNEGINVIIQALKSISTSGGKSQLKPFALNRLIPDREKLKKYYRYQGSLTTPGCDEAVIWTVFAEPIPISKNQLNTFSASLFYSDSEPMKLNFRPVQKLNDRPVYVSDSAMRLFNVVWLSVILAVWTSIYFN